jgi:hypothetical protein
MLILQEFIEPRVAHVQQVSEEHGRESDPSGGCDSPCAVSEFRASLLNALRSALIDAEDVRRLLSGARRVGLEWEQLYEEAVREVLVDQPYLAPSIPPISKVKPL